MGDAARLGDPCEEVEVGEIEWQGDPAYVKTES
jgi:hypothetical protein